MNCASLVPVRAGYVVDPAMIWAPLRVQLPSLSSKDGSKIGLAEQVGIIGTHDVTGLVVVAELEAAAACTEELDAGCKVELAELDDKQADPLLKQEIS